MVKEFLKFVKQFGLFSEKDKLILGVSGGVDSVVLLDLICKLFPKNEKALIHVDHSIRNDTHKDIQLINEVSKKYNIKTYISKIDVLKYCKENKIGTEEGARKLRYKEFMGVFKKENADYILTAHNLDDLAENLIMRITRGTGLDGLPGMKPKNGIFVKPLLFASKREIVIYAKKNNLKWRDDYTNSDLKYTRNSIRHKVVPILKEHNPNFLQSISKLSKILWIQKEHMEKEVRSIPIVKKENSICLNIRDLKSVSKYLRYEKIKDVLRMIQGNTYGFEFENIESIEKLMDSKPGAKFKKNGILVMKEYENLYFSKEYKKLKIYIEIYDYGEYTFNGLKINVEKYKKSNAKVFPITIKSKDENYKIKIKNGHKKINRFLSDKKIPHHLRDNLIIAIDTNNDIILIKDFEEFNTIFKKNKNYIINIKKESESIEKRS